MKRDVSQIYAAEQIRRSRPATFEELPIYRYVYFMKKLHLCDILIPRFPDFTLPLLPGVRSTLHSFFPSRILQFLPRQTQHTYENFLPVHDLHSADFIRLPKQGRRGGIFNRQNHSLRTRFLPNKPAALSDDNLDTR